MTTAERASAAAIVADWVWQPSEGHNYRFKYSPKSFVRFCECASMQPDEMKLVIEYLSTQTIGTEGVSLLGRMVQLGSGWKAMDAWYQTRDADKFNGTDSTKVRVYQVLISPSTDSNADEEYVVEDGCAWKVTHHFYWDVETLPTLEASTSGVSYTMQGVAVDRQTGLWSCVIEKRERVQQDIAEYTSGQTVFETTKEETHQGVKQASVAGTGKLASVANGKIVRRKVTKNEDCTSNVENVTVEERAVTGVVKTARKTLRGTVVSTTDRGQTSALAMTGLAIGETRRSEESEAGRWTNTVESTTTEAAGKIAQDCAQTIFEHTHSETENQTAAPENEGTAASGGVVTRISGRKTEEGNWDVTTATTTEKPVSDAVVVTRKTLRGTVSSTTSRNQTAALGTSGLAVGETRRSEKTEGGLYNTTVETTTASAAGTIGGSCDRTSVVHTDTTTKNESADPTIEQSDPGANKEVSVDATKNELGTWDVRRTTRTFEPKSAVTTGGSSVVSVTTETGVNQTTVPAAAAGVNQEVDIGVSVNDHGSYSTTKRVTTYAPAQSEATSDWGTETVKVTVTRHNTEKTVSATNGTASAEPDDHGAATTRIEQVTPKAVDSGWIKWDSTTETTNGESKYHHGVRIFANQTKAWIQENKPTSGSQASIQCRINKYGLFDGSFAYTDLYSWNYSSSGSSGGSVTGTLKLWEVKTAATGRRLKRLVTFPARSYHGSGNEGSESDAAANCVMYPGLHLPSRTYTTGNPTFGSWMSG